MEPVTDMVAHLLGEGARWVVRFFLAVLVLMIGWFIAKLVSKIVRQILLTADLDQRISRWLGLDSFVDRGEKPKRRLAGVIENVVYYILLIIVLIFSLEVLGETTITVVLRDILFKIGVAVPDIIKAVLILAGAWIIALIAKFLVIKAMRKARLGERLDKVLASEEEIARKEKRDVSESFGNFVFYFIMLFSLLAFFDALKLPALAAPLTAMFTKVFDFIPRFLAAGIVLVLGYYLARLCERIATNFALAAGVNRFVEGMRFETVLKSLNIARVIGTIVFLVIMVPVLAVTFQILDLPVVTGAFGTMMNQVAATIPGILGAFVLLIVGLVFGRYVGDLVAQILGDVGFDVILSRIGLEKLEAKPEAEDAKPVLTLSSVAGNLVMTVVVLFFVMEGFRMIRLDLIADAIDKLLLFLPNVLIAFLLLGLGFYLARVVQEMAQRSFGEEHTIEADVVGLVIRYAIIVFAFFMAFDQLGVAHSIVVNAFTILLGTVGLGLALAFGLGSKDHARDYIEKLRKRTGKKSE